MKKRVISLVLAMSFVFASVLSTNAASYQDARGNSLGELLPKTPTSLTYKDISRLADVASTVRGKQARIVNAVRYNGSGTVWAVRLNFGEAGDQCAADFILNVYPYGRDEKTKMVNTLPFADMDAGNAMFGPCWYYFGVFDDVYHNSCGFVVAERIKRWPQWYDLSFSGITYRGIGYTGSYPEESSESFMENHIN